MLGSPGPLGYIESWHGLTPTVADGAHLLSLQKNAKPVCPALIPPTSFCFTLKEAE